MSPNRSSRERLPTRQIGATACWLLLCLGPLFVGCSSTTAKAARPLPFEEVPAAVERGRGVVALGDATSEDVLEDSVKELRSLRVTPGLEPALRREAQFMLETVATLLIDKSTDPRVLARLSDTEIPRRLAVRSGVRGATLYEAEGERNAAFKLIRRLDQRYPAHSQRGESGDLLARIGFSFADDRGRYLLIFRYASHAPEVLEYLALEYPTHPKTDDALWRLAEIYEGKRHWSRAIEKHQELVLWAPDSIFRIASEARIPHLRLVSLRSPEYSRDEQLVALNELDRWLAAYAGHELEPGVRRDRIDCLQRLADNDIVVGEFYWTVANAEGARFHGRRALEEARRAGNAEQIAEAEAFLARVTETPVPIRPRRDLPDPGAESFDPAQPGSLDPIQPEMGPVPSTPINTPEGGGNTGQ